MDKSKSVQLLVTRTASTIIELEQGSQAQLVLACNPLDTSDTLHSVATTTFGIWKRLLKNDFVILNFKF